MNPRVLKEEGFKWLDRVVELCAAQGIYTIIDLHAAAGGQNTVRSICDIPKDFSNPVAGLAFG